VRNLREQLSRAMQQLEQAEMGKERLGKATARMEDLEEQLRIKNNMAKQLSQERSQLEINMTNTKKEVDRMSKNFEALQWRIRNHFDVPLDNMTPETCKQEYQEHQRTSLPTLYFDQQKSCTDWITKHLITIEVPENQSMSTNSHISEESNETTKINSNVNKNDAESDILPESKIGIDECGNWPEINAIGSDMDALEDVDSPDEGLGDVFTDGEHPESPDIPQHIINNSNSEESNTLTSDCLLSTGPFKQDNIRGSNSQTSRDKERLPSRFTFGH